MLVCTLNCGVPDQARDSFPKQSSRTELRDSTGIQKGPAVGPCINLVFLGLHEHRLVNRH